jgi:hypothetical protein
MKVKPKSSEQLITKKPQVKRRESIIIRFCKIVIEDIKAKLQIDQQSQENKMRYDAFMEMFR